MRLNVEHDSSLTSTTFEVSVAKHFLQLLIRKFYIHVAFMCKWQSINIDDVWMDISRNLVTPMLAEQRHSGVTYGQVHRCSCRSVTWISPSRTCRRIPATRAAWGIFGLFFHLRCSVRLDYERNFGLTLTIFELIG